METRRQTKYHLDHELDSMDRLPASWQMWDLRSKLFDQLLADVAFRRLLHLTRPHPKEWANWRSTIPQDPVLDSDGPTDVRPALELGSDPKSGFTKCVMTNGNKDESNLIIPIQLCSLRPIKQHQAKANKSQKTEKDIEQEFERFQTTSLLVIQNRVTHMSYLQQFIRHSWSRWLSARPASDLVDEPETMTIEKPVDWSELWRCRIRQARGRNKAHSSLKSGPCEKLGIMFLSHCQAGLVEQVKQDILENGLKRTSQCGLDPNIADHRGCFGLLWAVLSWNVELVNVLLDFGANVNQVTDEGLCVLSLCLLYYYRVMEQLNPNRILQSHIIDLGSAKCPTPSDGSISSKEPVNEDSSTRPYVYRAEVAMHLSDASAEDKRVLEEQARLAQFRRVYGVRTPPSRVMTVALPTVVQKSVDLDNSNQLPEQQAVPIRLPTFQRFTNCLTRLTKQLKLDVPIDASGLIKISTQVTRVKTPGPFSGQPTNCTEKLRALGNIDTSKMGVWDLSSKSLGTKIVKDPKLTVASPRSDEKNFPASHESVRDFPVDRISPKALGAAAAELARNPYFLRSRSISPATLSLYERQSLSDRTPSNPDPEPGLLVHKATLIAQKNQVYQMINLLLKRGADPNSANQPLPCLFLPVQFGDTKMVERLLEYGADPNARLRVKAMRKKSVSPGNQSTESNSPFDGDNSGLLEESLTPSLDGLTPLHYAVLLPGTNGVQICRLLLRASADPNKQASEDKSFTLRSSSGTTRDCTESIKTRESTTSTLTTYMLLEHTDEFLEFPNGFLPILANTSVQIFLHLPLYSLKHKSTSLDHISADQRALLGGRTPLQLACARDYDRENAARIVRLMLDAGADPNRICNGHSALSLAIASGNDSCVSLLLEHPKTNVNQELTHGQGSALFVASSRAFEFRRDTEARLNLIKKLIEIGGASVRLRMFIPRKRSLCNVIDLTIEDYAKDKRISRVPYHALSNLEKETYTARAQVLEYLVNQLRHECYSIEDRPDLNRDDGRTRRVLGRRSGLLVHSQKTGARKQPVSLLDHKTQSTRKSDQPGSKSEASSTTTPSEEEAWKKSAFYAFCYECGRSSDVRLSPCSRCHLVYFCSKACKLKAWTARHRFECQAVTAAVANPKQQTKTIEQTENIADATEPSVPQLERKTKRKVQENEDDFSDGLLLARYLLYRSAAGELIGFSHPAYQYQFVLNRYLRVNKKGRIFVSVYDGHGNYSLI
ncbi:Ankyrin repeat and MYND domain-containing protein 1 [Fasciola hepatica]|uniref:Ankyrin repeat and MYND domain-containing protein 1 n=1 Tax=Fasciola hepatica TaxID=6192 RepID=A0A4E0R914_FASHE|nr:Ankyrin repeat and MYND domain-containing protein 1 [Fasciola hepatica]